MARRKAKSAVGSAADRRSLPARGAKTTAINNLTNVSKAESAPDYEDSDNENALQGNEVAMAAKVLAAAEKSKPVFAIFEANAKMGDGLWVVRGLGDNKYEMVDLGLVSGGKLSSEKTGAIIAGDPGWMKILGNFNEEEWEKARFKLQQASMSANGEIFRFFKLPPEMRYKVYEISLVANKSLRIGLETQNPNSLINTNLLMTSHAVYDEAIGFWRRNTFNVQEDNALLRSICPDFSEKVEILSIDVRGLFKKDQQLYNFLQECTNVKILKVIYHQGALSHHARNRYQATHRGVANIDKFKGLNGFDRLCQLRGLTRIEIIIDRSGLGPSAVTEQERLDYENFLMGEVTQPRPDPLTVEELAAEMAAADAAIEAVNGKKRRKGKQVATVKGKGRKRVREDDSDSDYMG